MIQNGLSDITIAGTCLEYGIQYGCLGEDMDTRPVTNYGLAKDTLRKSIQLLYEGVNLKWVRLFYLYGDGQGKKTFYTQLQDAILKKQKVFNMSAGEQLRDYLPVKLAAEYIVKIALQKKVLGVINCCSGKPISMRRFAEQLLEEQNYTLRLNLGYYTYAEYEPLAFWGSTNKLINIIEDNMLIRPPPPM
jgi:dTDP-6-deoxy-L-talose 4-dehydrogenase (NAD+)